MKTGFENISAIIMAAGESTRFYEGKLAPFQKVMLAVANKPILAFAVELLEKLRIGQIIVVIGHRGEDIKKYFGKRVDYAMQEKRLGTADATKWGLKKVKKSCDTVVVVNGDDSFRYKVSTLIKFLAHHKKSKAALTFLTVAKDKPFGLGRVIRDKRGQILKVVEEKDASGDQRKISEVNCGAYIFEKTWLRKNISKLAPSKVTGEYYVVDLIELAVKQGRQVETYKLDDPAEWFGVNTPEELKRANEIFTA